MKERLVAIFNALHSVETKGQSTLIIADCIRELSDVIKQMEEKND